METTQKKDRPWLFKPGNPGGPGRPKKISYADIINRVGEEIDPVTKMTNAEALIRFAFSEAKEGKAWAVQFLVDRVEGKAVQRQEVKTENVGPVDHEQVRRQILTAAAEIQAWEAQKKKEPEACPQKEA